MLRRGFYFCVFLTLFNNGIARAEAFQSYATVVNVQPIVETSQAPVTRQVCGEADSNAHISSPLAATIGADIQAQRRVWRTQTACKTVTELQSREQVTAYRVTYRYRGQTKTTRLSYDPGERIPVNVRVSPML